MWPIGKNNRRLEYIQRSPQTDGEQSRPQRWNWSILLRPLDRQLAHQANDILAPPTVFNLRYFWLDGLFSAISDNFYLSFIPLFALTFGASNSQVGWLTAAGNLLGALAFFPGAYLAEHTMRRKRLVLWSGGGVARAALLGLAFVPIVTQSPSVAIWLIIALNALRAFMGNLANPAWTAMVADLVPDFVRGRYFGSRNMAMGVAALLVTPIAGRIISQGDSWNSNPFLGYQAIFVLSFAFGMVSTYLFGRIKEPGDELTLVASAPESTTAPPIIQSQQSGHWWQIAQVNPAFLGLVISAFVWNLSLQIAAPFFNVYLVQEFGASAAMIGFLTAVSSLTALGGQRVFGRLLDRKSALWVQMVCGFIIPILPLAWVFITASWQVAFINLLGGFIWAGYNLANFNLLLELTPDAQRPRAVALYQTAVFAGAVIGPLLGGYLADDVGFKLIFGLSSMGRLVGMGIFAWLTVLATRRRQVAE